ncbi:MAG: stage III sporulation protein AA [Clostridia bacterium]|nr:stage III sporulation protein AA [Clostridia bacterium]
MTEHANNHSLESALRVLPVHIRQKVISATLSVTDSVQEVVLRAGRPVCVYLSGEQKYLTANGCLTDDFSTQKLTVSESKDVIECFNNVCGYSVYSHISEIKEGFITIKGGHRAGISGTAVVTSGEILNIRDISTVSIRIAREFKGCAENITADFEKKSGGLLLCGSPCSGKTTVLRDMARVLSTEYKRKVSLIDTRGELASVYHGISQNDVGMSDILDGYPRSVGIEQSVRSLSPEIIICDEIGSATDAKALLSGVNSGVRFIASMHAGNKDELANRNNLKEILKTGAFEEVVFLRGRHAPGEIISRCSAEAVLND